MTIQFFRAKFRSTNLFAADDPESVIISAAKRLDARHFPLSQVGIQFVQIGTDPFATRFLRELDDELTSTHNIRVRFSHEYLCAAPS